MQNKPLPPDATFALMFTTACLDAASEVAGDHAAQPIAEDLSLSMVESAAFCRPGAQFSRLMNASAFERFLEALANALSRRGIPVRSDGDLADLSEELVRQTLLESDAHLLHVDRELEWSRMVQAVWREQDPQAMTLNERRYEGLVERAARHVVSWTVEAASPVARLVPPTYPDSDLTVYVARDAALPPDRTRPAQTWVDAVLWRRKRGQARNSRNAR
jgi:hypothetical protein